MKLVQKLWKHSILPLLSLPSDLLKGRCPAFKVNNDTNNKVSFPQRPTLLYFAHNRLVQCEKADPYSVGLGWGWRVYILISLLGEDAAAAAAGLQATP